MTQENPPQSSSTPSSNPPPPAGGDGPNPEARTMGMLCHLLGILTGFVGPLIIWLIKKDTLPFVDDQGKEALNFQLTVLIGYIVAGATTFFCIGPFIGSAVWIVSLIFSIMGAMKANEGVAYRYPVAIRLIK
ncbi:MAG: DUF4870 domain-containing protein [Phycisphaerales bacterium]|nr:DUF4870 domain-containing protein [Phycisphaerales bacterium]